MFVRLCNVEDAGRVIKDEDIKRKFTTIGKEEWKLKVVSAEKNAMCVESFHLNDQIKFLNKHQ